MSSESKWYSKTQFQDCIYHIVQSRCISCNILTLDSDLNSLHVWKLFAVVCEFSCLDVKSIRVHVKALHEYHGAFSHSIAKLSSPTCDWLTVVELTHLQDTFIQSDLVEFGRLPNLIALKFDGLPFVSSQPVYLDIRLVMHLGRLANERCFPRLRALFLSGRVELTERCFLHLDKLPALALLSLRDSRRDESRLDITEPTAWRSIAA